MNGQQMQPHAPAPQQAYQQMAPRQASPQQVTLEQFVHGQLAPHLGQGEQIFEYGVVHKTNGKYGKSKRMAKVYLAGITPFRIMLIETRGKLLGGFNGTPKFENHALVVHNLSDIQQATYRGVNRFGPNKMKPLRILLRDGTKVEYHIPTSTKICQSQLMLSTYPARLEHILTTQPPYPQGQLPPVPPDVLQQWTQEANAAYSKAQGKMIGIGAAGLLLLIMGIGTGFFLFALLGLPAMGFGFYGWLSVYAQKRFREQAGWP